MRFVLSVALALATGAAAGCASPAPTAVETQMTDRVDQAALPPLPRTDHGLVVRTDFSNDLAWHALGKVLLAPDSRRGFVPLLDLLSDRAYDGVAVRALVAAEAPRRLRSFVFLADGTTFQHPESPLLVVRLVPGSVGADVRSAASFRVVPRAVGSVSANLSIGNMSFFEYAEAVDSDGVFRGFRSP